MHLPHLRRVVAALSPLLAAACLLGLGAPAHAATAAPQFVTYDVTTKRVVLPTTFWASNLVAGSEITWDFTGDRPTPVLAASIARDSEVTAAISALSSLYQPLDADLTALAALNGSSLTNLNASTAFSTGQVPIARLASGTPTGSKFIRDDGTLAVPAGGGGGGDAYLANSQSWLGANNFIGDTTVSNLTVTGTASFGDLSISNLVLLTPMAPSVISNATPSRIAMFDSSGRLTNDVADTGTGAPVRAVSPSLTGSPTVPTASAGASNTLAASTAYVDRAVAAVPSGGGGGGSSTNDRIASWTADRFSPGTNATIQAQYRILGDGIPAMEFDGSTSEETSAIGVWQSSVGSSSYAVLTFASDDTANTVCWQVQLQSLALRGLDTNAWATASAWTSNVPGTARVSTNIIIPITSHPFSGSGTNDYGKPYMLRVTRLPGSDSSLSNAFLLSVDHRFTP